MFSQDFKNKILVLGRLKFGGTILIPTGFYDDYLLSHRDPIMDAALHEGMELPYCCKGIMCCTCKAKLVEGEVEMEVHYGLEHDEIAAGYILTCQSHPKTAVVVVDFDQR